MILALPQKSPSRLLGIVRKTALGLAATCVFLGTSVSALAGAAEFTALNTQLGGSKTLNKVATANTTDLVAAVNAVITANPGFKPGVVMGEALKGAGSNAPDIGAVLGVQVNATPATELTVATDAIKTAGSGKGLNVSQVPSFTAALLGSQPDAITLATNGCGRRRMGEHSRE
jgi:hypothetical protein